MSNYKNYLVFSLSILLFANFLYGQSLINAYGIGNKIEMFDAASTGLSSSGLVPSFRKGIALQNPSTWQYLNFTYFTGTYSIEEKKILTNTKNGDSRFGNAQFIVPFKNKYAFGLGIFPYSEQYFEIDGSTNNEFIAYGDTLTTSHKFRSNGGISTFRISLAGSLTNYINAGVSADLLYGSTRQYTVFSIGKLDYYSQKRHLYSGRIVKLFLNSSLLNKINFPVNMYFAWGFPLQSVAVETYNYKPFEDSDNDGVQDNNDFPKLSDAGDAEVIETDNLYSPWSYQFGLNYQVNDQWNLVGEYSSWSDKEENAEDFSILNDQIVSYNHFNIGIVRFGPNLIKRFTDRLNFRIGAHSDKLKLLNSTDDIKVYGFSTGISYNFGATNNQLDFTYAFRKRQGLEKIGDEIIQNFGIGITVGDIWFVKRRSQ